MPTYDFRNNATGEEFKEFFSMAGKDEFLEANPHIEQIIVQAPVLGDSARMGMAKPDDHFRDRLKEIKKSHHQSNINTW